ncbi:hypothetical protein ACFYSW_28945 [Rhodococcus aetherivorans]|uniref:hypothetical protein n=1 Tax=Rhodococcus aetherivorans TaxID=191292 RepID=UPI0036B997FD
MPTDIDPPSDIRGAVPTFPARPTNTGGRSKIAETMTPVPVTAESAPATFPVVATGSLSAGRRPITGTALQREVTTTPDTHGSPALSIETPARPVVHRAVSEPEHIIVRKPPSSPTPTDELGDSGWTIVRATDTSGVSLQRMFEPAFLAAPERPETTAFDPSSAAPAGTGAFVQREASAPPPEPNPSVPADDSTATPATGGTSPPRPGGTPCAAGNLEELAARLYEPLAARLRAELRHDRERAGTLTDMGR